MAKNWIYTVTPGGIYQRQVPQDLLSSIEVLAESTMRAERNISILLGFSSALSGLLQQIIDGPLVKGIDYTTSVGLRGGRIIFDIFEIAGVESETESHTEEELLFCLSGQIVLHLNRVEKILNEGDSILFFGSEPHSYSGNAKALRVLAR